MKEDEDSIYRQARSMLSDAEGKQKFPDTPQQLIIGISAGKYSLIG